jgi:hypothetical protein
MGRIISPNVSVKGKLLTLKQKKFLRFLQILTQEDKGGFMTLPEYEDICKEIIENGYYNIEQKERLTRIRDLMVEVVNKNLLFQDIYKEFMKGDLTTAREILVQVRLETYIQNIGKR